MKIAMRDSAGMVTGYYHVTKREWDSRPLTEKIKYAAREAFHSFKLWITDQSERDWRHRYN